VSSIAATAATAATASSGENRRRHRRIRHFLFIEGSSTHIPQYALGFMLVAFFTILIFILAS
jgi:hypothetical protein